MKILCTTFSLKSITMYQRNINEIFPTFLIPLYILSTMPSYDEQFRQTRFKMKTVHSGP